MRLFLCGFACSGKTTFGRKVSEKLSIPFFDTDGYLGDVATLYREWGEELFREKEWNVLQSLPEIQSIISLGGGTLIHKASADYVKTTGTLVYLKTPFEQLYDRIEKRGFPAYVNLSFPKESLSALAQTRFSIYEELADIVVDTTTFSSEQLITYLCHLYGQ